MMRMQKVMETNPWDRLAVGDARRVNGHGNHDYFWIILEGSRPGVVLKLDGQQKLVEPLPVLRSIETRYRIVGDRQSLVISLIDQTLIGLFETFCRDIVAAGEQASGREEALVRTVQRARRWHHLLRGGATGELGLEEQMGLIGELVFLRELVANFGPDAACEAWKGPEGASKDFEFPSACIEVKARRAAARPSVSISSLDQLADVDNARLFLRVTDVATAMAPEGMTLHDHVAATITVLQASEFAVNRLDQLLMDSGYDPAHRYDDRRWFIRGNRDFEVMDGFPRISPPLASGVGNVRYSVGLAECAPFELASPLLDVLQEIEA